jgi:capsular polysaccharide biosynthesis protein
LIQIDVNDVDVDQAHAVALIWAQKFVDWCQQQNIAQLQPDRIDAFIVQDPIDSQYRPQATLDVIAGGIMGLMLGAFIAFSQEPLESRTLHAPDDVESALGATVLGTIPMSDSRSNHSL